MFDQVKNVTQTVSPDEYDAAVAREPRCRQQEQQQMQQQQQQQHQYNDNNNII